MTVIVNASVAESPSACAVTEALYVPAVPAWCLDRGRQRTQPVSVVGGFSVANEGKDAVRLTVRCPDQPHARLFSESTSAR